MFKKGQILFSILGPEYRVVTFGDGLMCVQDINNKELSYYQPDGRVSATDLHPELYPYKPTVVPLEWKNQTQEAMEVLDVGYRLKQYDEYIELDPKVNETFELNDKTYMTIEQTGDISCSKDCDLFSICDMDTNRDVKCYHGDRMDKKDVIFKEV